MSRDVYMNKVQQRMYFTCAKDVRLLASRRFGKTDGSIAPRIYTVSMSMPKATNLWLGNSRKQLYTRTVPGTIAALERFYHIKEGQHFGWGRPPKGVPQPIIKPKTWDNCIWFANGTLWQLISLAITGSANSITANSIVADECKFMPKSKIDGEVMPALSGITHPFADPSFSDYNPLYKSTFFASDASLTAKNNWLEKEEEKLDMQIESGAFKGKTYRQIQDELIAYADDIIFYNELLRKAKQQGRPVRVVSDDTLQRMKTLAHSIRHHEGPFAMLPKPYKDLNKGTLDYLVSYRILPAEDAELLLDYDLLITKEQHFRMMQIQKSKSYKEHIRQLRASSFYFVRANSLDNIDILGEDYIARMKRDLPPVVFAISILNMKKVKSNDGFYSNLDIENIHGYLPDDCPAIDASFTKKIASTVQGGQKINTEYETPDFDALQRVKDCTKDGDVVDSLPLYIAGDWNANINWFVTGQVYKRDGVEALNVLSSMFVKNERKLRELCKDWNQYYAPHRQKNRQVFFFYDATAKFKGYAIEGMEDFKDVVINSLRKYGWDVVGIDMGKPMLHELKYKEINEGLAGVSFPAIRLNRENNESLIVAMETAEVQIGYNGFRKDKSGEKLSEGADNAVLLELRTDGTDAFDSLYIGVKHFRMRLTNFCMPGRR